MKRVDVCLKLILPSSLKDQIIDQLLKHPEWVGPFITQRVEGHGDPDSIASAAEQVRGYAERVQIEILMDSTHVQELLAQLRAGLTNRDVFWWLSSVQETGRLA